MIRALLALFLLLLGGFAPQSGYDLVIRGGTIYDGSGRQPYVGDVAIEGDRIAAMVPRIAGRGEREIDARGLAVAPGFINMLSWAIESLLRTAAASDIRQCTLEVMARAVDGPLTRRCGATPWPGKRLRYPIPWTTLAISGPLEQRGTPPLCTLVVATRCESMRWARRRVRPASSPLRHLSFAALTRGDGGGHSLIYAQRASPRPTSSRPVLSTARRHFTAMPRRATASRSDRILIEIARSSARGESTTDLRRSIWGGSTSDRADRDVARAGFEDHPHMSLYAAPPPDAAMPLGCSGRARGWIHASRPAVRARYRRLRRPGADWENLVLRAGRRGCVSPIPQSALRLYGRSPPRRVAGTRQIA